MTRLTDFLRRTFLDARGQPDGKLLTLFAFSGLCLLQFPVGWIWNRWAPDYIWSPAMLLIAAGLGVDAYVTKSKIQAEAGPAPVVENAANVTVTPPQEPRLAGYSNNQVE